MKTLDIEKAKLILTTFIDKIESMSAGMYEDWFWTANTIYSSAIENSLLHFDEQMKDVWISSSWATPCIWITTKDGQEIVFECSNGESNGKGSAMLGCLSEPVQDKMPPLLQYEFNNGHLLLC